LFVCLFESRQLYSFEWLGGTCSIICRAQTGECRSVDSEIIDDWKNNQLLQETKEYDICGTYTSPCCPQPCMLPHIF
jgi:hypothetical protein